MSRIIRHPDGGKKGWHRCYTCERLVSPSETRLATLVPSRTESVELELCNVCDSILRRFSEAVQDATKTVP